jgi:hypothetical protein
MVYALECSVDGTRTLIAASRSTEIGQDDPFALLYQCAVQMCVRKQGWTQQTACTCYLWYLAGIWQNSITLRN